MCLRFHRRVSGEAGKRVGRLVTALAALLPAMMIVSATWSTDLPAYPLTRLPASPPLRVCADPNNLPFSNERREGLENRLAELVARELNTTVSYVWWAQRRGFIRNTLAAGRCDVVMGVPTDLPSVLTTSPYYRSSYVFVSRADRRLDISSFDDPRLCRMRIGVQVVGDGANTPPLEALAHHGLVENLVGYTVFGDYTEPNPPARVMDAVAGGEVDIAIVWGPLAGFFSQRYPVRLALRPLPADGAQSFEFSISMAVRKDDEARREALDRVLAGRQTEIERLLDEYRVPRRAITLSRGASGPEGSAERAER